MKVAILAATAAALLLPTAAHAQQTVKPPTTTVKPANKNHSSFTIRRRNITYNQPIASTLFANSATLTKRISLDVTDSPVRDALKMVAMKANQELVIDNDVPQDTRITVRANDVQLNTALDLITQAAGVRWSSQIKDGKTFLRVGKFSAVLAFRSTPFRFGRGKQTVIGSGLRLHGDGVVYSYSQNENRSTFTCPHCKRQATVIRKAEAAHCPKCERVMQSDWQFCPNDGTKRPASETAWKFCPFCSRAVTMTEAAR